MFSGGKRQRRGYDTRGYDTGDDEDSEPYSASEDEDVFAPSSKTVEWIQSTGMIKSKDRGTVGYLTESDYSQLRIT